MKSETGNMNRLYRNILISAAALMLFSCSPAETIIKDKKIEITIPAIKDSMPVVYKNIPAVTVDSLNKIFSELPDSSRIESTKEIFIKSKNKNGIMSIKPTIKYYPKKKFFELDIPEQKVDTTIPDTTKNIIKKETTTPEKFGYGFIGIICFIIAAVIAFIIVKFKLV